MAQQTANPMTTAQSPTSLHSWSQWFEQRLVRPLIMPLQIALYRWSGGRVGSRMGGVRFLLLTATGRKSGKTYTTPLAYIDHEDGYVIAATNAGFPHHPGWYYNLKAEPGATIQVGNRVTATVAEEATGEARDQLWDRFLAQIPGYAAYQERTDRVFPMMILRPVGRI
jgi:F420H(2)-dependent quinone reductase